VQSSCPVHCSAVVPSASCSQESILGVREINVMSDGKRGKGREVYWDVSRDQKLLRGNI
jgi:hypothetical protein